MWFELLKYSSVSHNFPNQYYHQAIKVSIFMSEGAVQHMEIRPLTKISDYVWSIKKQQVVVNYN